MSRRSLWLWLNVVAACFSEPGDTPPSSGSDTGDEASTTSAPTTAPTSTATAADTSSTGPDATTVATSGEPVCGNELVEGDETCDDGNDVPADGCTECRTSLSVQWLVTYGGPAAALEAATSVSANDSTVVIGGALAGARGNGDLWVETVDPADGASLGRLLIDGPAGGFDFAAEVVQPPENGPWVTGVVQHGSKLGAQIETRRLEPDLAVEWVQTAGLASVDDSASGIALLGGGAVVGGTLGAFVMTDAWLQQYDGGGAIGPNYTCDCGGFGGLLRVFGNGSDIRAIARDQFEVQVWGFGAEIGAGPQWVALLPTVGDVFGVDVGPTGDTWICGSITGGNDVEMWVGRYDASGDAVWSATHDLGDGDQSCRGLRVGPDGALAVGHINNGSSEAYGFIARINGANGDLLSSADLVVEESLDTRVLGVAVSMGVPYVVGAYAIDALDDDAFVARLVP